MFASLEEGVQKCYFNRLETFKEQKKTTLNSDGLYTINRLCNLCRNQKTVDERYPGLELDDVAVLCREFVVPKIDYLVLVDTNDKDTLQITIDSIKYSGIEPNKVIFAVSAGKLKTKDIYVQTRQIPKSELVYLFEEEPDEIEVIDTCFKKCNGNFVAIFRNGYDIPSNFIEQVDDIVNNSLLTPVIITNSDDSINGTLVVKSLFDYMGTYKNLIKIVREQLTLDGAEEIKWNQG